MRAKINRVFEEEWITSAPFKKDLLEQGLIDIGLSAETIKQCKQELTESERRAQHETLLAMWNDPRYRRYRRGSINTGRTTDFPTEEELEDFNRAMIWVAHQSDGYYGTLYVKWLVESLKRILGFRELRTERLETSEVKIPLFKFNSPNIKGSEVIYEESESEETKEAYGLSILGTGLGTTRTIFFSCSNVLSSRDGANKLVYTPITLQNSLIGVYEKEKKVREFLRTELVVKDDRMELDIGVDELSQEEFLEGIQLVENKGKYYKLSGDRTNSVHTFKEALKIVQKFQMEVGFSAFNLKYTCKAQLSRNREVKLEFKLPAGYDYQIKKIMGGLGVLWT